MTHTYIFSLKLVITGLQPDIFLVRPLAVAASMNREMNIKKELVAIKKRSNEM